MADFKRQTELQRLMLDKLTNAVREYLEIVEKPTGSRHRKTTFVFVGDRYKPEAIQTHYVVPKSQSQ